MTPLQRIQIAAVLAAILLGSGHGGKSPAQAPAERPAEISPAAVAQMDRLAADAVKFHLDAPTRNWTARNGEGSCAWASLVNLLRWNGQYGLADWVRANRSGGATRVSVNATLDRIQFPYAETVAGDAQFLERACATRRGACVVVDGGSHMINLVGLDAEHAYVLGNATKPYIHSQPRAEFLANWKTAGGWAFTLVLAPPPPKPWIVIEKENDR